ncbi:MAG: Zn-dependent protease [Candidatus Paceibacteria bacterium]|jgi:Zn-dependent protease
MRVLFMQGIESLFYILILIISVVIHEVAHGYAALRFGDKTALYAGRLTLNPLKHLDWFGSVILPGLLVLSGTGMVLGWAKPVPYNPNNLSPRRKGVLWVAMAGIIANIITAILFALILRVMVAVGYYSDPIFFILQGVVLINIVLAVFNLVPIPPLDGSKVLFELLPYRYHHIKVLLEKYSIFLFLAFIFFGWQYVSPVVFGLFSVMTGTL